MEVKEMVNVQVTLEEAQIAFLLCLDDAVER